MTSDYKYKRVTFSETQFI